MTPSAKAAERFDCDLGLLLRHGDDIECPVTEQKLEIGPAGLAFAAFDDEGELDPVTAESSRAGASPRACAKRSASDSPKRMATSAEVSTTIQRHMPVSS